MATSALPGRMHSRRRPKTSSMRILPFIASSVSASTLAKTSGPRSRASSSIPSIELSVLSQAKQISFNAAGLLLRAALELGRELLDAARRVHEALLAEIGRAH